MAGDYEEGLDDWGNEVCCEFIRSCNEVVYPTVVACVDMDVLSVTDPVRRIRADKVHLIVPDGQVDIRRGILEEVRDTLSKDNPDVKITEHPVDTRDVAAMMRLLIPLLQDLRRPECSNVNVNLSSGTNEFAAAAMTVCMQYGVRAFTVRPEGLSPPEEDVLAVYHSGIRSGLHSWVSDPVSVPVCDLGLKEPRLSAALEAVADLEDSGAFMDCASIIRELMRLGAWDYVPEPGRNRTGMDQKGRMYLYRNYIGPLAARGWIVGTGSRGCRYSVTPCARRVMELRREVGA